MSILCLHQSAELYGSDRSFLSAIEGLSSSAIKLDVMLPFNGELVGKLNDIGANVSFYPKGVLRKQNLKKPLSYAVEMLTAVIYYLKKFSSYDVIYINTVVLVAALLAAIPYGLSTKRIVCHVREIPTGFQLAFFRMLFKISNVELIFNSKATMMAFNLPGKVIYNGVHDILSEVKVNNLLECEEQNEKVKLLMIGRINTWKGQDFLLEALAKLPSIQRSKIFLRIVGSPFEGYEYLENDLLKKINDYGLNTQVKLIPFCSDPSEHYLWADYVVVPSTKPEPFGRVAVEAFSASKPVIAAGHGGLTEIVSHSVDGFLFPPCDANALAELINSIPTRGSNIYSNLSSHARRSFESRFSVSSYQSSICSIFAS